jgi:hypothetical protein
MIERASHEVETLTIRIPIRLQHCGGRKLIMTPEGVAAPARKPRRDDTLIKALVRAHRWRRQIESGAAKSITDLAEQEGVLMHTSAGSCHSPAWRPTLWKRSWTGGSRRGSDLPKCWVMGRWGGRSSGGLSASASPHDRWL